MENLEIMEDLRYLLTMSLKILNGSDEQAEFLKLYGLPALTHKHKKQTLQFYFETATQLLNKF